MILKKERSMAWQRIQNSQFEKVNYLELAER